MMNKNKLVKIIIISSFIIFIVVSYVLNFEQGIDIGKNFYEFSLNLILVLPCAFILIGLFEAWVKRETVEKHLGKDSGFISYLWAVILGGCTFGPLIVALPIAYSLYKKGAKLTVIFTYLGAAAICRIPMTIFEASYLGVKFTIIRYVVSIPLVILTSIMLGSYLEKKKFKIMKGK
ncbi:MAG: permease [Spirochaetales bacterium]|nr:permease [Spirochaetales bacterium]